ncbi:TonB-dependent siderophore receptor [Acinetobacter sp. WU_MDCI_Axc73]|nr:TonB-dependent siderophore receptor [Acinetobacter sp. WU_MDCI_Axc73]
MQRSLYLLSSLVGFSCFSQFSWSDNTTGHVLSTISLQAQEERSSNETQTVASTKFLHDVLDVPFSRSYLSQEILKQQDVQRIDEAIGLVSGVFAQNSYGGGLWDNYSIRGFTVDPNVSATIIRNGLSVNRGLSAPRDMVNIESLDFLKGPAAALYGRGEIGGLLNITAKKPQWEPQGQVYLRANTEQQYRGSFEYTAPINDQLAYRFAIAHEDNHSFRDYVRSDRWFFSPQLSWKISDQTQLDFESEITQHQGTFDRGISAYNGQILMNSKTFTGEPDDGKMKMNDQFYQTRLAHEVNDNWQLNSAVSYKEGLSKGFSTEPKSFESDGETLNRQRRYRDYSTKDVLAQTELLGKIDTDWARHEILMSAEAGQFISDQYQLRCDYKYTGARYCINKINVYQPVYGLYLPNMGLQTNTHEKQDYLALNLQDQLFFNDQWSILIGNRFDHVKQSLDNRKANTSSDKTFNQASPRAGINYKINNAVSVYTNYGRSFAMNSGTDANGQVFAPEKGESYEVGSKYQPTDNTLMSMALFHMKKRNVLTTDPNDPTYQHTAGEARSQGVELSLQTQIGSKVDIMANYTYTDAKITKDLDSKIQGARLNSIPLNSANLGLNYKLIDEDHRKLGFGGNLIYVGKRNGTQDNLGKFELPSYTIMNLNAYYEPSQQLRYQFNLNNLLDKTYYVESYNEMWIQPGDPLNASLSVQWTF